MKIPPGARRVGLPCRECYHHGYTDVRQEMSSSTNEKQLPSRRTVLKTLGLAPWLFRASPFHGAGLLLGAPVMDPGHAGGLSFSETHLKPHYPSRSPLEDVLRLVPPGADDYVTEKYAFEIQSLFSEWASALKASPASHAALTSMLDASVEASAFATGQEKAIRGGAPIESYRRVFEPRTVTGPALSINAIEAWLKPLTSVITAEFEITDIKVLSTVPDAVNIEVRYDVVGIRDEGRREERVGSWRMEWARKQPSGRWKATRWSATEELLSVAPGPVFADVTAQALHGAESYTAQMRHGADYWRTVLDGACGIDVYGNNGVAAGDYDNDGFDDLYICQGAGLPNRLYRNRGDGTFEDVTEKAGVGVLDNTACALFADFRNIGLQDLLVVCGSGPLLFLNQGNGSFTRKQDAFKFATAPEGTFTHAALMDYDRDGRLDVYFCLYSYYLGLDQYHYPIPYFDARNGPPNFLLHNEGDGSFVDRTEAAGLSIDNNRYSFACAWGEANADGFPDLYVANDFGRNSYYRNNGNGTFTSSATSSHVEDVGAGMSACWSDIDNDGKPDIYVANMWSSAGQRVSGQKQFQQGAPEATRALYRRHAHGNALYRNDGENTFQNITQQAGVEMGRWAWCSDFIDFDHDGYPDIYVTNGYISAPERASAVNEAPFAQADLGSFFWRQVVGRSPEDSTPSLSYEHGWNALNELIRSDNSWSGRERNVLFANNQDGTFSEASGPSGLDFLEDSRSFALADIDHDGRLEIILKNRSAPQLRVLHNGAKALGHSIVFRLRGTKSNHDAIGAAITVDAGTLKQTRYLQAGSGFLAQHSKEVFFGLGHAAGPLTATVHWPSGLQQTFENLPVNQRIQIEEGSPAFTARPFASTGYTPAETAKPSLEVLPEQVETWLIEPLKAPDFSLPDLAGNLQTLSSMKSGYVLLTFWMTSSTASQAQLKALQKDHARLVANRLQVIAMNVDGGDANAKALAMQLRLPFSVVFATEEIAGIYNIVYRYLYDRRRDLPSPASFLLDQEGMIVKVYQGVVDSLQLTQDVKAIPTTAAERLRKALPFPGSVYQGSFQRNDFTYGVAMFQHGYLAQAAESFQQVVAAKPDSAEGFYNLGTLSLRRNNFVQARDYLQTTLKLRPNYPEAWNNLGMMAAQEGKPEEAIAAFQQSLQLRPGYAIALLNLGNVYRRQGAFAKAQESLTQALALQPDDPEVNYSLGMFYAQQSQMDNAADYLRKAIALRPDYPEALNNLGVLFVRQRDYTRAEEQFMTCIRLVPAFDQSYINLARVYALQNEKDKARAALQALLKLQPDNKNALQAMDMLNAMP